MGSITSYFYKNQSQDNIITRESCTILPNTQSSTFVVGEKRYDLEQKIKIISRKKSNGLLNVPKCYRLGKLMGPLNINRRRSVVWDITLNLTEYDSRTLATMIFSTAILFGKVHSIIVRDKKNVSDNKYGIFITFVSSKSAREMVKKVKFTRLSRFTRDVIVSQLSRDRKNIDCIFYDNRMLSDCGRDEWKKTIWVDKIEDYNGPMGRYARKLEVRGTTILVYNYSTTAQVVMQLMRGNGIKCGFVESITGY